MPKSILVYLIALFFLIGSMLFLSSFFLNTSSEEIERQNSEIIFEAKNISLILNFKESNLSLKIDSSMINSLKEEKNLYVFNPVVSIFGKDISINLISDRGKISYDKNIIELSNNISIKGNLYQNIFQGDAESLQVDLNDKNLKSEKIILFLDDKEISFNEINFRDKEIFFKGEPLYLKTSDGLQTETSFIRLKSSGELIIPKKIEVKSLKQR